MIEVIVAAGAESLTQAAGPEPQFRPRDAIVGGRGPYLPRPGISRQFPDGLAHRRADRTALPPGPPAGLRTVGRPRSLRANRLVPEPFRQAVQQGFPPVLAEALTG